ncbi:MAG TPA: non-homologous end-joining DNA ligase [Gemmatimonas sp.]|nr:non-homologous end-joining DNA ligase [Gemmatimonas sp.]
MTITHPERIVFPDPGITKGALAQYYATVAPRMLPHVAGRPLSLVRCPQGQGKPCFYQKHWANALPEGLGGVEIDDDNPENDELGPYVFVKDVRGLVALVQHGVLELHIWGARADKPDAPDRVVFDLDPAPDVPWSVVLETAQRTRRLLREYELDCWLKTSGGKGLHVVVPVTRRVSWNDVHDFSRLIVARLLHEAPDQLVDVASKAARPGKIYVDYQRNARGATAVAPWSTRARDGAPVSIPVPWTSASKLGSGNARGMEGAAALAKRMRSDPWADMLTSRQGISAATMQRLMRGS